MNPIIKGKILKIIENSKVVLERHAGTDIYHVTPDTQAQELITILNGWDYGTYSVSVSGQTVSHVEWYENANKPKTPDQKDVFEIINAASKRIYVQNKKREEDFARATAFAQMSDKEKQIYSLLSGQMEKTR